MTRGTLVLSFLLIGAALHAQTTYTQTLPTMEGSTMSNWRSFTFPNTTPTTGGGAFTFQWRACWQQVFGGTSKIWIELETSTGVFTQVYYETGNGSDCAALSRSFTVTPTVLTNALNTGAGELRGRVKIQDSCYPGVGCAFYNDPQVLGLTLTYDTHAANFNAADATVCPGSTVEFDDASLNTPSSYEWLFPGGTPTTSTAQNPTVQYVASGSYDVTLIVETVDGMDTLVRSGFVTVFDPPLANAGVDEDVCVGESAQLQASGGTEYLWFPSEGLNDPSVPTPTAIPSETTSYTVLVTNGNGCQASDNMVLTVRALPNVQASAGNNTICLGDTANVVAVGAQLYQWSPNLFISAVSGASVDVWPTSDFSWTVTGTDAFGCVNTTMLDMNVDPPPAAPTVTNTGLGLSSSTATAYQWLLNGEPIPDATEQEWLPQVNGNYSVRITDANGCSAVGLPVYFGSVGLDHVQGSPIRIYPQPVQDRLVVEGLTVNTPGNIIDAQGAIVWKGTIPAGPRSVIDLSALSTGVYVLELGGAAQDQRLTIVKQ